jgi:uncharacterized protein (DUF1501 family)
LRVSTKEIDMSKQHQSTSWQVLARTARHLRLDSATRLHARAGGWLSVAEGRVWITHDGGGLDHVLERGERFWLAPGQGVVAEAWRAGEGAQLVWAMPGESRVQEPSRRWAARPAEGLVEGGLRGVAALLRGAAGRLLAAARSADAMASRAQGSIRPGDSMASCGAAQ